MSHLYHDEGARLMELTVPIEIYLRKRINTFENVPGIGKTLVPSLWSLSTSGVLPPDLLARRVEVKVFEVPLDGVAVTLAEVAWRRVTVPTRSILC